MICVNGQQFDTPFVQVVSETICRHGLRMPALIVLEASRPLSFLVAQLLWVAQPTLSLLYSSQNIAQLARLWEEPDQLNRLITHLETDHFNP